MMVAGTHRVGGCIVVVVCLIVASVCYSQDKKTEAIDSMGYSAKPSAVDVRAKKTPSDEKIGLFDTSGLVEKIGKELHDVIREERSAAFAEIDKERRATLAYLSQERQATMTDLEAIGDRAVENALLKSERLIDHFFVRVLQVGAVTILAVCILGYLFFRIKMRRKSQS